MKLFPKTKQSQRKAGIVVVETDTAPVTDSVGQSTREGEPTGCKGLFGQQTRFVLFQRATRGLIGLDAFHLT